MKKILLMGIVVLSSIPSFSQTITAPSGQSLTITNPVDITVAGGSLNIPSDGSFKIGGNNVFKTVSSNLIIGKNSGMAVGAGIGNTFLGENTGNATTSGNNNLFIGTSAGQLNIGGSSNAFLGINAGYSNNSGASNLFLGTNAGYGNIGGSNNIYMGSESGRLGTAGNTNTFIGANTGYNNTGNSNLFLGANTGVSNTSGSFNTYVGYNVNPVDGTLTNVTLVGAFTSATTSNTVVLGNAATTITGAGLSAGSGLRFANLTSSSPATTAPSNTGGKVLSVNSNGDVILVALSGATTASVNGPVAESTWKDQDGYLYNNSTNGVVINGTGLEGNALIVKGGVLSKEVNVKVEGAESWPDYVFKPAYKRMSLEEVEKFISINGHLPNVASATEMAATGNNLNKTDIKLLEKVEELTLYLLEMKKANDAQSTEIQSLKNQMNKLKKNRK